MGPIAEANGRQLRTRVLDDNQQPSPGARRTPGCRWKATPSVMTPVWTPATQGPGYGDRAAASDAVLRSSSRLWVPWLAGGCRGAGRGSPRVSGLKPDWPPSTATVGIAPAGAVRRIVSLQPESG